MAICKITEQVSDGYGIATFFSSFMLFMNTMQIEFKLLINFDSNFNVISMLNHVLEFRIFKRIPKKSYTCRVLTVTTRAVGILNVTVNAFTSVRSLNIPTNRMTPTRRISAIDLVCREKRAAMQMISLFLTEKSCE